MKTRRKLHRTFAACVLPLLLMTMAAAAGCIDLDKGEKTLLVYFNNDVRGQLDPCGCRGNPTGGFAKRHAFLNEVRSAGDDPIVLDAGDLLTDSEFIIEGEPRRQARRLAGFILEMERESGLHAITPGEKDLSIGYGEFAALAKKAGITVLAANIRDGYLDRNPFADSIVLERDGVRLGVTGLLSPGLFEKQEDYLKGDFRVLDPVAEGRRVLEDLKGRSNIQVVMAHLTLADLERAAAELEDADFFLAGHPVEGLSTRSNRIGGKVVLHSGSEGRFLGQLRIVIRGGDLKPIDGSRKDLLQARIRGVDAQIDAYKRKAGGQDVLKYFASKPEEIARIRELLADREDSVRTLDKLKTRSFFDFRFVPLDRTFGEDVGIAGRIERFKGKAPDQKEPKEPAVKSGTPNPSTGV